MNKDTVVASVIGFGLGLIAAIALWVVPRVLPAKAPKASPVPSVVATTTTSNSASRTPLTLSKPQDGEIVTTNSVTIEGKTSADALILVSSASSSASVTPKEDGSFSTKFDLSEGGNQLVISAVATQPESKTVTVYFYPDEL